MSDEEKVKNRYPKAWAKFTDSGWIIREDREFWSIVLGEGDSPEDAWANTAQGLAASETKEK